MVDGHVAGETPVTVRDLTLGTHALQIARPGFAPHTQEVTLTPGVPQRTVAVTLEKGLLTLPGAPMGAVGAIDVDSRPRGARVSIDGRVVGVTPLHAGDLSPGRHEVSIALPGYRVVTTRTLVEAGRAATVRVSLER
jgi:hypothetical protein